MLSEHETIELLEQLKQEAQPGTVGFSSLQSDVVGHWPVLIGGGMCLNLQTVATLELNSQPEHIYVTPTFAKKISCIGLASGYHHVHHLGTGVDGRTLIIAYDQRFSSMLSLLQETRHHSTRQYFTAPDVDLPGTRSDEVSRHYEFSQAIATSIDPGPSSARQPIGQSFLPLDTKAHELVGSWRLQLKHKDLESGFFIGLINTHFDNSISLPPLPGETFSITVRAEKICRSSDLTMMLVELAEPDTIKIEKTDSGGNFPMLPASDIGEARGSACEPRQTASSLLVHRMLQLSVDDLYLLLAEAAGTGIALTFSFAIEPFAVDGTGQLLQEGCNHRCLSVNGLPVRQGYLSVHDSKLLLKIHE